MDKEVGMKQYASTKRKEIQMCILLLRTAEEKLGETLLQHLICTVLLSRNILRGRSMESVKKALPNSAPNMGPDRATSSLLNSTELQTLHYINFTSIRKKI